MGVFTPETPPMKINQIIAYAIAAVAKLAYAEGNSLAINSAIT